jgi:hypothetical protein
MVEVANVRFTTDGNLPTIAGVGELIGTGVEYWIIGTEACRKARFINQVARSGATVQCEYYY